MVPLTSLWLPILLSAVLVFVASSIIHMVLGYHRNDFRKVPNEDVAMTAIRSLSIPPGDYMMPKPDSPNAMKDPAFQEKFSKGPVMMFTVMPPGPLTMGPQLAKWFVFCLVVSLFAAYVASRGLPAGTEYLRVSQMASCVAFIGYTLAYWPQTIWYKRSIATTVKATIDGIIFGFITGGTLGWLWPS